MGEADRRTIASGTPGMTLMEAAGRAVAEAAAALVPEGPVLVVAGPGNNGGDGFVAARRLMAAGRAVSVSIFGDPGRLKGDAALAFERWPGETRPAATPLPEAALVIDALFGAGLDRPVAGPAAALVEAMNAGPAPVLAVDLPSGLDSETGRPLGATVRAAATVTFSGASRDICSIRAARSAGRSRWPTSASRTALSRRLRPARSRTRRVSGRCGRLRWRTTSTGAGTRSSSRDRWRGPGRRG